MVNKETKKFNKVIKARKLRVKRVARAKELSRKGLRRISMPAPSTKVAGTTPQTLRPSTWTEKTIKPSLWRRLLAWFKRK